VSFHFWGPLRVKFLFGMMYTLPPNLLTYAGVE